MTNHPTNVYPSNSGMGERSRLEGGGPGVGTSKVKIKVLVLGVKYNNV